MERTFFNPYEAIDRRLAVIEELLLEIKHRPPGESNPAPDARTIFDLDEFCQYARIGKQTAYRLTSRGEVPHSKRGRRIFFDKAQVDAWLLANSVGGKAQAERTADNYVMSKRRARRA